MTQLRTLLVSVAAGCALLGSPHSAHAWDPSTTHVAMVQEAAIASPVHRRWMDQSSMEQGLFSPVRIDPHELSPAQRRAIILAIRSAHAGSGSRGLGGPGACPGPSAPPSTRRRCVEGDLWEMTALGWMKLGLIVELMPRARLLQHFVDRDDPASTTWADPELPKSVLRAKHRRGGGAWAKSVNRTAFEGQGPSAIAWIADEDDPWAPRAALEHLRKASTAPTHTERDHHLGLALLGMGALLHVAQDLSVPAQARGDLTAFFAPLSGDRGDRGLPLQEYIRMTYGRAALPRALALRPRAGQQLPSGGSGPVTDGSESTWSSRLADDIVGHLLGSDRFEGLIRFTAGRFLSESSVPAPVTIDPTIDAQAAATLALGDGHGLDVSETDGARLSPWPATAGYLVTSTGRGLAAYDLDDANRLRLYLDRRVYREQAAHLIPKGVEVSVSLLDLLLPAFCPTTYNTDANLLELDLRDGPQEPTLRLLIEDANGRRTSHRAVKLRGRERNRIIDVVPETVVEGTRLVMVLEGLRPSGAPWVAERYLDLTPPAEPVSATPSGKPATGRLRPKPKAPPRAKEVPAGAAPSATPPGAPPSDTPSSDDLRSPFDQTTPVKQPKPTSSPAPSDDKDKDESKGEAKREPPAQPQ